MRSAAQIAADVRSGASSARAELELSLEAIARRNEEFFGGGVSAARKPGRYTGIQWWSHAPPVGEMRWRR